MRSYSLLLATCFWGPLHQIVVPEIFKLKASKYEYSRHVAIHRPVPIAKCYLFPQKLEATLNEKKVHVSVRYKQSSKNEYGCSPKSGRKNQEEQVLRCSIKNYRLEMQPTQIFNIQRNLWKGDTIRKCLKVGQLFKNRQMVSRPAWIQNFSKGKIGRLR